MNEIAIDEQESSALECDYYAQMQSKDDFWGMAILMSEDGSRSWAMVKEDIPLEIWDRLEIGTWIEFSDNQKGCVKIVKAFGSNPLDQTK